MKKQWYYVKEDSDGLVSWDIHFGQAEQEGAQGEPVLVCEREDGAIVLVSTLNVVSCGPGWNSGLLTSWQNKQLKARKKKEK